MKRISIILLAVGLVAALSVPVFALDVKVTGRAEMTGYWESNRAMVDNNEASQRYFTTFIRIEPVFKVAEGLQLVTRFEGLERVTGLDRMGYEQWHRMAPAGWAAGAALSGASMMDRNSENEQNFAMKRAYIDAKILGGQWWVGYQQGGNFGTDFMDYYEDVLRVKAHYFVGPFTFIALWEKAGENSLNSTGYNDSEYDKYALAFIYKFSGKLSGQFGYLQYYLPNYTLEQTAADYKRTSWLGVPYFMVSYGPFYLEGEIDYTWGKMYDYGDAIVRARPGLQDIDHDSFSWYLKGKYTFGPAYAGIQLACVAGDDPTTADKNEAGLQSTAATGYSPWQPVLILWNDWTSRYTGQGWGGYAYTGARDIFSGNGSIGNGGIPQNVFLYQFFGGYKPIEKLELQAAITVMEADQAPTGYMDKEYGTELDLYATYKFYDNLSYTVAFGYLWAGDYWKGTNANAAVGDDWLLMHKLTLTF